jgi:hypothetical protein
MVIRGTPTVRGLDRRAHSLMTVTNQMASSRSMTVPIVGQERLVIVGASGIVGSYALHYALNSSAVLTSAVAGACRKL